MRTRTRNLKRLLSLALCLCMVTGLLPVTALAADAPVITTESLAKATVGEEYTAALEAEASDPNGELIWSATGLPQWLTLTDNTDGTATLTGTPGEAGEVKFTVTVTETIPAAESEEPGQGTDPAEEAEPAGPTVLTDTRTYALTVAEAVQAEPEPASEPAQEPAQEPVNEPAANAPLTDGAGATRGITANGTVSATIYLDDGDGQWTDEEEKTTFPVDQAGLILHLDFSSSSLPSGAKVESIAFYPTDGTSEWGAVFWFNGNEEHPCNNGKPNDKLAENGVFQIHNFTPNGNMDLVSGQYKVLAYVGYTPDGGSYQELYYLSNETFTITAAAGPGTPVISTSSLPTASVDEPYSQTLSATPGTAGNTLTWSISDGTLPAGLTLSENGTISGTPTAEGSYTFTVQVSETVEGETLTATKQFTLKVTTKLEISTENGETTFELTRGKLFSLTLQANMDVTWRFQAGYIPGLRLSGGTISGTVSSSTSSGTYTATMRATAADGQTADLELTFIVGDLFAFTLPTDLDPDAYDHYAYLLATQNSDGDSTLWSGTLRESSNTLVISSRFSGETVSNVRLAISLKGNSDPVVLASAAGPIPLADGGSADLDAVGGDVIATLPKFDYGELEGYVTACYMNEANNYNYYPGDLVDANEQFTLGVSYISRTSYSYSAIWDKYNLNRTPTFSGSGVKGTTYTPGSGGGPIKVTFPLLEKRTVTFTLKPLMESEKLDLVGSTLSIGQYTNRTYITTAAKVLEGNTCSAELYLGLETRLSLRNCPSNCGLNYDDTTISELGETQTLHYWTSKYTSASLMVTTKPAYDTSDELLRSYANYLGSSFSLTITVDGESWPLGSCLLDRSTAQSRKIWNSRYSSEIADLIEQGSDYTLSWSASSLISGNKTCKWNEGSFSSSAEDLPIHFKGGVLLELDNALSSGPSMQDWWYYEDAEGHGSWISGKSVSISPRQTKAAFYCPGENGTYGFILLPREAQPTGMTWAQAAEYFDDMPSLGNVVVKDDTVTKGTGRLTDTGVSSTRYLTLPNSTLSGPAQFSTTNELLSYTGGIQLDDGVGGKLKTLRIDAAGTDAGSRVAFQINSLQINGKTYPYSGIHLSTAKMPDDTLVNEQFQTYYLITFQEPISLPCTFSIYGNAMTVNSDVKLTLAAKLEGATVSVTDQWQPLGTITTQAPSISVSIPSIVGTETATAYLTLPGSGSRVDIYDGETLVVSAARAGEVEIPLVGTSPSRVTTHNLSFRWHGNPPAGASSEAYEVTVLHANGAPTLTEQLLQTSYGNYGYWDTYARDTVYSYESAVPPDFRAVCTIENYENLSGDPSFLFYLLDGSVVEMALDARYDSVSDIAAGNLNNYDGETVVSKPLHTNSPVISVSVLYEINWKEVEKDLQSNMPPLPTDSPSRSMDNVTFTETVVIPYEEHNVQFSQLPEELPNNPTQELPSRRELWDEILKLQGKIEDIYEENDGQAGFYIIDLGNDQFLPALEMINGLDTEYISQGDTGTTTMTRPLDQEQLEIELGSGEWSRYSFTEPGESGGGETTGMEVYTQSVSTESGVEATITIATNGEHTVEFATARGEGTGRQGFLPPSDVSGTGSGLAGQGGFSFTNFASDNMSVFSNFCGDVTTGSNTIKDITAAVTGAEATGLFKPLEQGLGAYSFGKDMMDGMNNQLTLADLLNAPNNWLSSPCAQKLPAGFRQNMENQINQLIKDVRDAEGWNMAVTGANYVLGAGGLVGMFSNPFTAAVSIVGGAASWFAGKITSQKITNVQQQATLLKDIIDMKITQTAISTNDRDCLQKSRRMDRDNTYRVCIDPSGVVYEAVLSNPVEGATVTLYTDGTGYVPEYSENADGLTAMVDGNGNPVRPSNADDVYGAKLTTPEENSTIPAETVLTTGADGRFQWNVQQGLWYVTAEKEGYEPGDSGKDIAAVVNAGGINWLPVAPEQLNVNIPLVSFEPPTVTSAEARADGVYLTFSKYMDEDTLTADNFTLIDSEGNSIPVDRVQLLNSEKAPANINYLGAVPSYTSQVKLWVNGTLSGDVTVTIDSAVESYAGAPCASTTAMGTFSEGALVDAPEVEGTTGTVDYGTTVTLTIPYGAAVYYTTDGSNPSFDRSGQPTGTTIRYYEGLPIVITKSMTLNAVAVKYGVRSEMVPATFTVPGTGDEIPGGDDEPDESVIPDDPGGRASDSSGEYLVNVGMMDGGKITVNPGWADEGDTVTLTVKPNSGYALSRLTVTDAQGSEMKLFTKDGVKYTFIMPDSRVTVKAAFVPVVQEPVNPFTDVSTGDYYYNSVLWAVANGVTSGASATTFAPNATVTRAQAMTFLWRAHGSPKATGSNPFTDVSASDYYYEAVLWAVANGVTSGTSETTFSPNAPVTRAQAMTFQWRAAGSPVVTGDSFDDVAADAYYAGAVTWAVANGITNGTGGNKFSPEVTVTRAQAVTFLWRELA